MNILNSDSEIKKWAEQTPLIPYNEAEILYDNDYYDGPQHGILVWKNKNYYFYNYSTEDEVKNHTRRIFAIIEMTKEQEEEEKYWENLLAEKTGFPKESWYYHENFLPKFNWLDHPIEIQRKGIEYEREHKEKSKKYTLTQNQIKGRWSEFQNLS